MSLSNWLVFVSVTTSAQNSSQASMSTQMTYPTLGKSKLIALCKPFFVRQAQRSEPFLRRVCEDMCFVRTSFLLLAFVYAFSDVLLSSSAVRGKSGMEYRIHQQQRMNCHSSVPLGVVFMLQNASMSHRSN